MKTHYLVGFAALALAFAGCSKNEVLETEGSKTGNAISFSTYAKGSKGTAIDNTGLQTAGNFGVTAFLSTTGQDAAYMGALDKGAKIIYNTAWGYEVASDTRYWPDASTNLAFYGYTPFDNATRGDVAPAFGKTTGMVFDNYVVPIAVADQEDFMWAYTSTNKATSGANGVLMTFHHALVRVNFKARVTTSTLKVD
ncbi:MAG: fimbrillin family protein, partial [Mucinivorans sp.]